MDSSDWIALAALVVSVVSGGGAVWYARQSAAEAGRSADEAERLTRIEADRRSEEKERRHEELAPNLPVEIEAALGGAVSAGAALYGLVQMDRAYRVKAFGRSGPSLTQLAFPSVTRAREPVRFVIEPWTEGSVEPSIKEIVFKLWPPAEGDVGNVWSCGCGRAAGETETVDGPGHWERRVKVNYYRLEDSAY